jgi:hypothetical protein
MRATLSRELPVGTYGYFADRDPLGRGEVWGEDIGE